MCGLRNGKKHWRHRELSVYSVSAHWCSGWVRTPSRYLELAGKPVIVIGVQSWSGSCKACFDLVWNRYWTGLGVDEKPCGCDVKVSILTV